MKTEGRATKNASRYSVSWQSSSTQSSSLGALVRKAVRGTLERHQVASARVSVIGVGDPRMAQLNKKHLGHPGSTDVLTFDLSDGGAEIEGEIVISLDTARREAKRRGHSASAEAALYAVHGVLHLLGYDDHEPRRAARMHRMEDEILASVGLRAVYASSTAPRARTSGTTPLRPPLLRGEVRRT